MNDQALALVKKPNDNPTSQSLTTSSGRRAKKLAGLDAAAFDKANIDNEVAYHESVNEQDAQHPDFRNRVTLSPRSTDDGVDDVMFPAREYPPAEVM